MTRLPISCLRRLLKDESPKFSVSPISASWSNKSCIIPPRYFTGVIIFTITHGSNTVSMLTSSGKKWGENLFPPPLRRVADEATFFDTAYFFYYFIYNRGRGND